MEQQYDRISMEVASSNVTAETLARLQKLSETEQFVENLIGMYGLFFEAVKHQLVQKEMHCLTHSAKDQMPGGVTPMFDPASKNIEHLSYYKNLLQWPYPEVYSFNLGWGQEPKRTSVLKTLIAIPQRFDLRDLYNSSK